MMRTKLAKLVLLAGLISLQGCGMEYSAHPTEAYVVDSESGKPLEGVIVVAHWQLEGGLEGGNNLGQMMIMETITDTKGRFHFPAWGPKPVPMKLLVNPITSNARLKGMDPQLLLFKHGYKSQTLWNERTMDQTRFAGPPVRSSDWNGKTIKLKTFPQDENHYDKDLGSLQTTLWFAYHGENCEWKSLPKMLVALSDEQKRMSSRGQKSYLRTIENFRPPNENICGSARSVLEEFSKQR